MKATLTPPVERSVTLEMTEDQARALSTYLGSLSLTVVEKWRETRGYFTASSGETYDATAEAYYALEDALEAVAIFV